MEEALKRSLAYAECDASQGACRNDEFNPRHLKSMPTVAEVTLKLEAAKVSTAAKQMVEESAPIQPEAESETVARRQLASVTNQVLLSTLFANYEQDQDRAVVKDFFLQAENDKLNAEAFMPVESKVLWSIGINYLGKPHKLAVLVSRKLDEQGQPEQCASCQPIIGAALFTWEAEALKVVLVSADIMRAAYLGGVEKPLILEPIGNAWVMRFEFTPEQFMAETTTSLVALLPEQGQEPARFINPLNVVTHIDERNGQADCPNLSSCKVLDVKLDYNHLTGAPLHDLFISYQGYQKTSYGKRVALNKLDYYVFNGKHYRCLDRKLSDSECRPNSPWKRTGAGRVFMENLQGLPIARRVIREQEVPSSSDVDGQGAAGIKPCRCRPILGQGRTKIFTVGIRHSLSTRYY
jgi:hypothetical protein